MSIEKIVNYAKAEYRRSLFHHQLMQERRGYVPQSGRTYAQTSFFRDAKTVEVIDRELLPSISKVGKPNILMVGLGFESGSGYLSYTPYKTVAHLEARGVHDFDMTLVDCDSRPIESIRKCSSEDMLYLYDDHLSPSYDKNMASWNMYLQKTNQVDVIIATPRMDSHTKWFEITSQQLNQYSERERNSLEIYHSTPVPASFAHRVQNGSIRPLEADIAVADIFDGGAKDVRKFHFCELMNVLYLLSTQGQRLALLNISLALEEGACILFDDGEKRNIDPDTPMLKEFNGWLGKGELRDLGLSLEVLDRSKEFFFGKSLTGILRKVGPVKNFSHYK